MSQEVPQDRAQMQKMSTEVVSRDWLSQKSTEALPEHAGDRKASPSWQSGEVADDWKKTNTTSSTQKDKEDPGNYGQISLTLVLGTVKEQIILETFSENNNNSNKGQDGDWDQPDQILPLYAI